MIPIKRALISVSDKTGLDEFVQGLHRLGIEIISTGGTAARIASLGIPVKRVSEVTGMPEMLDGRVKTLHPKIHAGLLAVRDNSDHMRQVREQQISLIDMVVVNLYPFEETVAAAGVSRDEAIEQIDIGGPAMLRSAAKNSRSVAVICNPQRYAEVLAELRQHNGALAEATTAQLAAEVFSRTAGSDQAIARYLSNDPAPGTQELPEVLSLSFAKVQDLRYGENPHQQAAFYRDAAGAPCGISAARQLHGKELSFNNILDLDAALRLAGDFCESAAVIIKHSNPCGCATAATAAVAFRQAWECDPLSAFGGIVGFNRDVDAGIAAGLQEAGFLECIIAPGFSPEALPLLQQKKNVRLLVLPQPASDEAGWDIKRVTGGVLVQNRDTAVLDPKALKVVTARQPSSAQFEALRFAWTVVKHVKSNAIVLAQGTRTVGIGAGQTSRVDSVQIAVRKAGERSQDAVLASDAFFPKEDSIEQAAAAGISAIIQPGGSIRDADVIAAADRAGIAMVFTGRRHFRH